MSQYGADWIKANSLVQMWKTNQDGRAAWEAWQIARRYPGDSGMREVLERIEPFIDAVATAVLALDGMAVKRPEPWRMAAGLAGRAESRTRHKVQAAAWRAVHAEIAQAMAEKREVILIYGDILRAAAEAARVSERTARAAIDETPLRNLPRPEKTLRKVRVLQARKTERTKPDAWKRGAFSRRETFGG